MLETRDEHRYSRSWRCDIRRQAFSSIRESTNSLSPYGHDLLSMLVSWLRCAVLTAGLLASVPMASATLTMGRPSNVNKTVSDVHTAHEYKTKHITKRGSTGKVSMSYYPNWCARSVTCTCSLLTSPQGHLFGFELPYAVYYPSRPPSSDTSYQSLPTSTLPV